MICPVIPDAQRLRVTSSFFDIQSQRHGAVLVLDQAVTSRSSSQRTWLNYCTTISPSSPMPVRQPGWRRGALGSTEGTHLSVDRGQRWPGLTRMQVTFRYRERIIHASARDANTRVLHHRTRQMQTRRALGEKVWRRRRHTACLLIRQPSAARMGRWDASLAGAHVQQDTNLERERLPSKHKEPRIDGDAEDHRRGRVTAQDHERTRR
jgi:hypothetical protein